MSLTLARLGVIAGSFPVLAGGDFESIATVTVGSGGASSITFSSIPGTYQHLQVRGVTKDSGGTTFYTAQVHFNSDTGNNYATHYLQGDGSSVGAGASQPRGNIYAVVNASGILTYPGATVLDILNYSNTSINTTTRSFSGSDQNGSGYVGMYSGVWMNTSAVTSMTFTRGVGGFVEHSTLALYGVRA